MPRSRTSGQSPAGRLAGFFSRLVRAVQEPANALARAFYGQSERPVYLFERLEERLQFLTLGGPSSADDGIYEFLDAKKNTIRVAWHDITFELIGADVGTTGNTQGLPVDVATESELTPGSALVPPSVPPTVTANIFTIYILQSSINSWLEAALVPPQTQTGTRDEEPFNGGAGQFQVNNANDAGTTVMFSPPGDSGVLLLGALHTGTATVTDGNEPITEMPDNDMVTGPRSNLFIDPANGNIMAGLYMSPIALEQNPADPVDPSDFVPITQVVNGVTYDTPNDLGYFHWAGTIFGNVLFPSPAAEGDSVPPPSAANSANPQLNIQGGNVGEFYAGCILTGTSIGLTAPSTGTDASSETPNFVIDGDIRDLVTSGSIGGDPAGGSLTAPNYSTGFDASIEGTVGQIYLREGNFIGSLDVEHLSSIYGLPDNVFTEPELEYISNAIGPTFRGLEDPFPVPLDSLTDPNAPTTFPALPAPFSDGSASTTGPNSIGTPQYLGSIKMTDPKTGLPLLDANGNQEYAAEVSGDVQGTPPGDAEDNYAVPLLAGQTMTVTVDFPAEVIDPDGRVVATNFNEVGDPFQYTADRPGEYTVQLGDGDVGTYTLAIEGVGDMALGTLSVPAGSVSDAGISDALEVQNGDLGAVVAGISIVSGVTNALDSPTPPVPSIAVPNGNLRTIKAGTVGLISPTPGFAVSAMPTVSIPDGTLGLVDGFATGTPTLPELSGIQTLFDMNNALSDAAPTPDVPFQAIGGAIQRIQGADYVWMDVATNQGIGDIDAFTMATPQPSFIDVNADNVGNDGIIDLISVTGDLGTIGGGPGIMTHDGGYVRYMQVGGTIYQDAFFGGGTPTNVTYDPGQTVTITDDTGATLQFVPQGPVTTLSIPNPNDTSEPENATFGPQVNLTTYGIRDKGGPVIVNASVTNNFVSGAVETLFDGTTATLTGQAEGLTINATGNGAANDEADISSIGLEGESTTTVGLATNATTGLAQVDSNGEQQLAVITPTGATTLNTLSLIINGSAKVDVMSVVGYQQTSLTPADITEVQNNTPGELLGVTGASIGPIFSGGSIGVAQTNGPTALLMTQTFGNALSWDEADNEPTGAGGAVGGAFPFGGQGYGVVATSNILSITSNEAVGNIYDSGSPSGAAIGSITANANGKLTPGVFSGIDGPILAAYTTTPATSRILVVNIGQGLLFSGTGSVSFAGIYAFGDIGTVTNNGVSQADIRGDIITDGGTIDNINLGNGSIINSNIIVMAPSAPIAISDFARVTLTSTVAFALQSSSSSITTPTTAIRKINISGNGGILQSTIEASNIGPTNVGKQGYGIFGTTFETGGDGVIGTVSAGGYGIRNTTLLGGAVVEGLSATGNGSQLPVTNFGTDVRPSDLNGAQVYDPIEQTFLTYDPFTGEVVGPLDDLNANLGTSTQTPVISTATDTGVLQDDVVRASTSLGPVNAQTIRTATPVFQPITMLNEEPAATIPVPGQEFPMEFNVAGTIGSVNVRGLIDGLEITTGHLGSFTPRGSVSRLGISVAGSITSLTIRGNLGQFYHNTTLDESLPDSYIQATGAEGSIGTLTVSGDMDANITATNTIGRMTVGGNVNGTITAQGSTSGLTLGYLRINGQLADGSLIVDGNAGTIISNGSFGNSTGSLTVQGNLNSLSVGASHRAGSSLELPLTVNGSVGSLTVYGRIDGAVTIQGDLKTLKVTNDGTQANIINGAMSIGGRLHTANIIGGNIAANMVVNNTVTSFTLNRGSVLNGATIQSQIDAILNFRITGGTSFGMFGSLLAASGLNENINISGDVGDGTHAATITAATGNQFIVHGSIRANATMAVAGQLNLLHVYRNIETNANVSAHPLKKLIVGGTNTGNVITV